MQRRNFLGLTAVAATAGLVRPSLALPPDHPYMQKLGLQLYTVRNQLAEDLTGTLTRVADAGYRQVELMDVAAGAEIAKVAKDQGMGVTSSFFDWRILVTPDADGVGTLDAVVEAGQKMGLKYLVFGYIDKPHRETLEDFQKIADRCNAAGEKIRDAGMRMCYHNHAFEFKPLGNDMMGYEVLMERFDKELVSFELDVFWAALGGWSPVEMLKRLGERVSQLHLKDLKPGTGTIYDESMVPETAFQEVGDGSIDFQELIAVAQQLGVDQCHVEQDQSTSPLESVAQSFGYLRDLSLR